MTYEKIYMCINCLFLRRISLCTSTSTPTSLWPRSLAQQLARSNLPTSRGKLPESRSVFSLSLSAPRLALSLSPKRRREGGLVEQEC